MGCSLALHQGTSLDLFRTMQHRLIFSLVPLNKTLKATIIIGEPYVSIHTQYICNCAAHQVEGKRIGTACITAGLIQKEVQGSTLVHWPIAIPNRLQQHRILVMSVTLTQQLGKSFLRSGGNLRLAGENIIIWGKLWEGGAAPVLLHPLSSQLYFIWSIAHYNSVQVKYCRWDSY